MGCASAWDLASSSAACASLSRWSRACACSVSRRHSTTASVKPLSLSLSLHSCVSSSFSLLPVAFAARSSSRRWISPFVSLPFVVVPGDGRAAASPFLPVPFFTGWYSASRSTPSSSLESSREAMIIASSCLSCCCDCGVSSPHCV